MLKYTWILLGLVGCIDGPIGGGHSGPRGAVYDDGTAIRITGCTDGAPFGCNTPAFGDKVLATVGGVVHEVPQSSEGATTDQLLGLFSDGPFQITLPRPADGQLGLDIAGATAQIALPMGFAIDPVPGQVKRSNKLTITHEVIAGARTWGVIISTCGASERTDLVEETIAGTLEIDFADLSGTCTHEIHVDQRMALAGAELVVDATRVARVTVTSTP